MSHGRSGVVQLLSRMTFVCALLGVAACESYLSGAVSGPRVIEFRPSGIRYGSVALSPSRGLLACERFDHDRGVHDILILSLDRSAATSPAIVANGESPIWLSDERILFYRRDAQGDADIWMASVGQPGARALTATPAAEDGVSVAPDRHRLLIARATILRNREGLLSGWAQREIVLAELREDRSTEIAVPARGDAERGDPSSPHWSPDGQQFMYARRVRRGGPRNDLYVMNADGADDRLLVRDAVPLAWTADGKSIYYQRRPGTGVNGEVNLIGVDGRGERLVLADTYVPASGTLDAQWNLRHDRLALATTALVGDFDASGFRAPTGIVLLNEAGAVASDLRKTGSKDVLEGGVQWDAHDRLVFARHTDLYWSGDGPRGGIFTLDPASGEERRILADTETFAEK